MLKLFFCENPENYLKTKILGTVHKFYDRKIIQKFDAMASKNINVSTIFLPDTLESQRNRFCDRLLKFLPRLIPKTSQF